jgi:wyosine [tRNA(Phe)-imidazoG37] synthetase (radical SAM superfamily)
MPTFLFDNIIFGPVWSRRLGESLGINLLPLQRKVCNYNCIYCECGLTPANRQKIEYPHADQVLYLLRSRLTEMKEKGEYLDSITFAGNGEPTLHPAFPQIMDGVLKIRNELFPTAKIAVLSNSTLIGKKVVFNALLKADLNILKLDSAIDATRRLINCPKNNILIEETIDLMKQFHGKLIIQTLFLRGNYKGKPVDNTTETEVSQWLRAIKTIQPEFVMIYSIARDTAVEGLAGINPEELKIIAERLEKAGINVQITP